LDQRWCKLDAQWIILLSINYLNFPPIFHSPKSIIFLFPPITFSIHLTISPFFSLPIRWFEFSTNYIFYSSHSIIFLLNKPLILNKKNKILQQFRFSRVLPFYYSSLFIGLFGVWTKKSIASHPTKPIQWFWRNVTVIYSLVAEKSDWVAERSSFSCRKIFQIFSCRKIRLGCRKILI
jgi:hypothetical protein